MAIQNVKMVDNTPVRVPAGEYHLFVKIGTGTATMEFGKEGSAGAFQNMVDGAYSADHDGPVILGAGHIRVQLTGDAEVWLDSLGVRHV